jgi:hypothetical protein
MFKFYVNILKTLNEICKMKKKGKEITKQRNHIVLALIKREGGAGAHQKSKKAVRNQEKIRLKKSF